jgi:hypothetical protein
MVCLDHYSAVTVGNPAVMFKDTQLRPLVGARARHASTGFPSCDVM